MSFPTVLSFRPATSVICNGRALGRRAIAWVLLASAAFLAGCDRGAPGGPRPRANFGDEVRRLAQPVIDAGTAPGMVIGTYDAGRTEVFAVGSLAPDDRRVPDGDTIYEIGSVSKVFTSLLLADATARGEVRLDDPIDESGVRVRRGHTFPGSPAWGSPAWTHLSGSPAWTHLSEKDRACPWPRGGPSTPLVKSAPSPAGFHSRVPLVRVGVH